MEDLVDILYGDLVKLAGMIRSEKAPHLTFRTTDLVHEAYLKLLNQADRTYQNRKHFLRTAACAIRQIILNRYRDRQAQKRGGDLVAVTLSKADLLPAHWTSGDDWETLSLLLTRLAQSFPRQAEVVDCRFFAGYGIEETAELLDISPATVKRDWEFAKSWLFLHLTKA
ncbi:ECF-type sigma factor [Pontibacter sp. G13]|uniref:ECF-type sigma factor n=1 Tax=Pontibacter sp. G13 TaxID=3074898 RepID=UPI00288A41BC|nr:ECF-type sigma factor [Pontibacter sp. G13]WNJ21544.1 ECF-type sigma factor [Pontibacter sp. G13]